VVVLVVFKVEEGPGGKKKASLVTSSRFGSDEPKGSNEPLFEVCTFLVAMAAKGSSETLEVV